MSCKFLNLCKYFSIYRKNVQMNHSLLLKMISILLLSFLAIKEPQGWPHLDCTRALEKCVGLNLLGLALHTGE